MAAVAGSTFLLRQTIAAPDFATQQVARLSYALHTCGKDRIANPELPDWSQLNIVTKLFFAHHRQLTLLQLIAEQPLMWRLPQDLLTVQNCTV